MGDTGGRLVADPPLTVTVAASSDTGRERDHNEDRHLIWRFGTRAPMEDGAESSLSLSGDGLLLAVCDGMGGEVGGQIASGLAVETLEQHALERFETGLLDSSEAVSEWLSVGLQEANRRIHARSQADPKLEGMGSTVTAAALVPDALVVAHVGDSRVYHLRGGRLRQLTLDHSFVAKLVAMGRISATDAQRHENKNLLLQVVGGEKPLDVDTVSLQVSRGDRLLLCSDGLFDLLSDEWIERTLAGPEGPAEQCRRAVDAANDAGGRDNITVIIVHVS